MDNPDQKASQHQAHGYFRIDAGAAVVGTINACHFSAKPLKIENLIDPHQHVVIRDQATQRSGDEKLQLTPFLPTQHRSPSSTDIQSESEAWGFFNSPPPDVPLFGLTLTARLPEAFGIARHDGDVDGARNADHGNFRADGDQYGGDGDDVTQIEVMVMDGHYVININMMATLMN
jgi:hypothetical protein